MNMEKTQCNAKFEMANARGEHFPSQRTAAKWQHDKTTRGTSRRVQQMRTRKQHHKKGRASAEVFVWLHTGMSITIKQFFVVNVERA